MTGNVIVDLVLSIRAGVLISTPVLVQAQEAKHTAGQKFEQAKQQTQ